MPLQKKNRSSFTGKTALEERQQPLSSLRENRRLKDLRKGPTSKNGLRKMIMKFEETGNLGVLPGRGRKPVRSKWSISVTRVGDSVVDNMKNSAIHFEMISV
ncbi:hypothetical protein TNCV_831661 [Trichonephila clavipes]|nr:hypothetical protein TNCV_831661 [Trichonephila clavipes]